MVAHQEAPMAMGNALVGQDLANEQQGLLDLIDKIQHAQLDGIKLPRIVVVGDQSAGKSSVLEAVTGIPFPRDAGACTRFATEIRLRRAKEVKFNVSILPDVNRQPHEKDRLNKFAASVQEGANFETVMHRAVNEIAPQNIPGRFAAKDVLVVEKTAPDLPLLTVVDLPGLVGVANKEQSEEDMKAIDDLTNHYMKSSRTIILAIIGGNQDYIHQKVLEKAKHYDPRGSRTIGVLTKPDVTKTIGLEDKFIALVNNQDSHNQFKLGWFVLRNPGPHDLGREWTPEERQQQEDDFFSGGKWSVLPATMRGATALKQKLSQQLIRHIARYVPKLRKEIQQKLFQTEAELKSLGAGKDTPPEMREDLVILSTQSQQLVTPAAEGTYRNPPGKKFFPKIARKADPNIPTPPQNLRARIVKENEKFADRVREQGHHLKLISSSNSAASMFSRATSREVSKEEYARDVVEPFIEEHMGTEFKGDYNPRLVYRLFHDFSDNWAQLAQEHKINVGIICNEFLAEVIDDSWPAYMREKLRTHFLDPQMNQLLENAQAEVEKLEADQQYEVQSYDPEYEKRLRAWQMSATTEERRYTTAEELLEKALIHYDLSAKTFISNAITQVVERHLLQGLYDIFNPVKITRMTDQEVEDIALESIEIRERRLALRALKKNIQESLEACANVAMRKELRTYAAEGLQELEASSDDEAASDPSSRKQRRSGKPVEPPFTPASISRQQQQRRASPQNPVRVDTPANATTATNRYSDASPETPAPNYNRRSNEQRMPGDWEESHTTEKYRPGPSQNQYASPAAPQYTPPPPPPRPAKVPTDHSDAYQVPPSPAESMDRTSNLGRYAYSSQDLNSRDRSAYENPDNFGQTSARKSGRKVSSFLKAQAS